MQNSIHLRFLPVSAHKIDIFPPDAKVAFICLFSAIIKKGIDSSLLHNIALKFMFPDALYHIKRESKLDLPAPFPPIRILISAKFKDICFIDLYPSINSSDNRFITSPALPYTKSVHQLTGSLMAIILHKHTIINPTFFQETERWKENKEPDQPSIQSAPGNICIKLGNPGSGKLQTIV